MAQRALDRRLTDELMRFKNTIAILTRSARLPSHCRSLLSPLSHHCAHLCPTFVFISVSPLCSHLSHHWAHLCPTIVLTSVPPLCSPMSHLCAHPYPTFAHLCPTFVLTYVCPTFVLTCVPSLQLLLCSSPFCHSIMCLPLHFFYTFIYSTILIYMLLYKFL